jgi:hypothetical protein
MLSELCSDKTRQPRQPCPGRRTRGRVGPVPSRPAGRCRAARAACRVRGAAPSSIRLLSAQRPAHAAWHLRALGSARAPPRSNLGRASACGNKRVLELGTPSSAAARPWLLAARRRLTGWRVESRKAVGLARLGKTGTADTQHAHLPSHAHRTSADNHSRASVFFGATRFLALRAFWRYALWGATFCLPCCCRCRCRWGCS